MPAVTQIDVKDANSVTRTLNAISDPGAQAAASSRSVVPAAESLTDFSIAVIGTPAVSTLAAAYSTIGVEFNTVPEGAEAVVEGRVKSTWVRLPLSPIDGSAVQYLVSAAGAYQVSVAGLSAIRVRALVIPSGTIDGSWYASAAAGVVSMSAMPGFDSAAGKVLIGNSRDKFRFGFDMVDTSVFAYNIDANDLSRVDGNVAGASYHIISKCPLCPDTYSEIVGKDSYALPAKLAFGASISHRLLGQEFAVDWVAVDDSGAIIPEDTFGAVSAAVAIVGTVTVASNIATINTAAAHPFVVGQPMVLYGNTDSRINYGPGLVKTTPSPTSLTVDCVVANGTYPAGGFIRMYDALGGSKYGASTRFQTNSANNADAVSRNGAPTAQIVNWNPSNTATDATVPNENGINYAGLAFTRSFRSKGEWTLSHRMDLMRWKLVDQDAVTAPRSQSKRGQHIPDISKRYKLRYRARNFPNMSRPVARCTGLTKGNTVATFGAITAGSGGVDAVYPNVPLTGGTGRGASANITVAGGVVTVCTLVAGCGGAGYTVADVLTAAPANIGGVTGFAIPVATITATSTCTVIDAPAHGLTVGTSFVTYHGGRDQTVFANVTTATAVVGVWDANTIVLPVGTASSAATYGGFITLVHGGQIPTIENRAVQTYAATADGLRLQLIANTTWTEVVGGTVLLYGAVDSTNTPITGIEGKYRVALLSTTTLELEPLEGQVISGIGTTPINAGGAILRVADFRAHYARILDMTRVDVNIEGGDGHNDLANSVPVAVNNTVTVTANNLSCNTAQVGGQTPITFTPNGATNRATVAGSAGPTNNVDYNAQAWSAASGSGATIANAQGLGSTTGFDINVTAITLGSSVGCWVYVQESMDNGTTWVDIWQSQLISSVSHVYVPPLGFGGRRRMRWQNINATGGAQAATTVTVTVNAMDSSIPFVKQVCWFDRTNNVTAGTAAAGSSAAYSIAGCKAVTAYVKATTATAAASYQMEFSNNGTDWFPASAVVPISALTANVTPIPATAGMTGRFARLTCTAAGTAQLVAEASIYGVN